MGLSYLMPKESFVLHCCVKERTFVSEEVTNYERKTYILKKVSCYTHTHTRLIKLISKDVHNVCNKRLEGTKKYAYVHM